ncbi:MAG: hypothetical protein ACRDMV_18650 [Streptosporangiales bacterium]
MSDVDAVLHIGMQQSGARMLQRALSRLRPQLRAHGITYIGQERIGGLTHAAGWASDAAADAGQAPAFARELADAVTRERAEVVAAGGTPGTVLVSSDHLVGRENIGPGDGSGFRPQTVPAVAQVIEALGAARIRIVLYVQRQDRLLEYSYLREVQKGRHHDFATQFPYRLRPVVDYVELVERVQALPQVTDVTVRPIELAAAGRAAFVDDFLSAVGLGGLFDLVAVVADLSVHRVYSRRGLRIALAMNPHLDDAQERAQVRDFLLEHFAAADQRACRFMPTRVRQRILDCYRDRNELLFHRYLPDLPPDSYADDASTARLGTMLHEPSNGVLVRP